MLSIYKVSVTFALLSVALLCACSTTEPEADTVTSVSYNIFGRAPKQTLTVDESKVRFESELTNVPSLTYDTTVTDADFLRQLRTQIDLPKVVGLTDRVDSEKLAVDHPLLTITVTYQLKGAAAPTTKTIKFTDPAHDELSALHDMLRAKASSLRR
jgi:hypothetical protein